jgi:RHS repeat-associated protein
MGQSLVFPGGHVSNPFGRLRASIIVKDEGEGDDYDWYRGLAFTYYGVGPSQLGLALWDRWKDDGQGGFADYEKLALREFRYHPNPRGRFMVRDLDPEDAAGSWSTIGAEHWTDPSAGLRAGYDRAMPYGDFDVTISAGAPVETEQMRYLEGFGLPAQQTVSTGATQYLHGDLLDSTVMTTNDSGSAVASVAYTAFGEPIGTAPDTRYQYAGGWGYESDLLILEGAPATAPITLQHVGHRWYDPSIGRFIQRDPIGVSGGLNVYLYCSPNPLSVADPEGLCPYCGGTSRHRPGCPYYVGPPPPPRPPWRPPNPIGPGERIVTGLAKIYVWITPESWDDPVQVARQRQVAARIALVCIVSAANPYLGIAIGLGEITGVNDGIIY